MKNYFQNIYNTWSILLKNLLILLLRIHTNSVRSNTTSKYISKPKSKLRIYNIYISSYYSIFHKDIQVNKLETFAQGFWVDPTLFTIMKFQETLYSSVILLFHQLCDCNWWVNFNKRIKPICLFSLLRYSNYDILRPKPV